MTTQVANFSHLVQFESLAQGDIDALAPALKQAQMTIAYPHLAEPVVAKFDGEIIGFAFSQLLPHWEPLWVKPQWRGTGLAEELAKRALQKIVDTGAQRILVVTQNQFAEDLAKEYGFKEVPGKIFVREP